MDGFRAVRQNRAPRRPRAAQIAAERGPSRRRASARVAASAAPLAGVGQLGAQGRAARRPPPVAAPWPSRRAMGSSRVPDLLAPRNRSSPAPAPRRREQGAGRWSAARGRRRPTSRRSAPRPGSPQRCRRTVLDQPEEAAGGEEGSAGGPGSRRFSAWPWTTSAPSTAWKPPRGKPWASGSGGRCRKPPKREGDIGGGRGGQLSLGTEDEGPAEIGEPVTRPGRPALKRGGAGGLRSPARPLLRGAGTGRGAARRPIPPSAAARSRGARSASRSSPSSARATPARSSSELPSG